MTTDNQQAAGLASLEPHPGIGPLLSTNAAIKFPQVQMINSVLLGLWLCAPSNSFSADRQKTGKDDDPGFAANVHRVADSEWVARP